MQNPIVCKLKAVNPELAEIYHNRIMFLQDHIETCIQEFEAMMEQRRRDLFEVKWQEDEQRKMLAEHDHRWKQEEEEKRLAVEEAEKKVKEEFLQRVKEIAANNLELLTQVGFRVHLHKYQLQI
jgi:hypothetical protein